MSSTNVGSIDYDARIDLSKLKGDVAALKAEMGKAGEGVGQVAEKGESRAKAALGRMVKFAKYAGIAVGVAATAAIGKFVIKGGIDRLLNIEDAQAKLKGLGHDANNVGKIMDNALASVKGTAFGLDAAATTAAGAVAAGIKPGKALEGVLKTVANSAALAGTDMGSMGAIFNKVATSNKAQMDVINQLGDRGIPVLQFLAKEMGVTAEEAAEMASDGKISFEIFSKAMKNGVGNAAEEMGKTTRGAWMNMQAAMARVGAAIVKDIVPSVRDSFMGMTKWFDDNSDKIVESVGRVVDWLKDFASSAMSVAREIGTYLQPKLQALLNTVKDLAPSLKDFATKILGPLAATLGGVLVSGVGLAIDALNGILKVVRPIIDWMVRNEAVTIGLAKAFGLLYVQVKLVAGVMAVKGILGAGIASLGSGMVASAFRAGGLRAALSAVGTSAVGTAAKTNILVAAIVAGTAAQAKLTWEMTKMEATGQATTNQMNQLRAANSALLGPAGASINMFSQLGTVLFGSKIRADQLKAAQDRLKLAQDNVKLSTDALRDSQLSAQGAALGVERAQKNYSDAVKQFGPKSLEAREAAHALKEAQNRQKDASNGAKKAAENLKTAQDDLKNNKNAVKGLQETQKAAENTGWSFEGAARKVGDFFKKLGGGGGGKSAPKIQNPEGLLMLKGVGKNAGGTSNWRGGLSWVGEEGPELINLPRGSKVYPHEKSMEMASGSGITNNIGTINIAKEVDADRVIARLTRDQDLAVRRCNQL